MNSPNKDRISDVKNRITPILKSFGVQKAALFGSVVRGDDTSESDIDILVSMPKKSSLFDLSGLRLDLVEALGTDVDVITYDSIKPRLKESILSSQIRII